MIPWTPCTRNLTKKTKLINTTKKLNSLTQQTKHTNRHKINTHTEYNRYITDGNDIRPHTAQIYNERTSTDLNLVTA